MTPQARLTFVLFFYLPGASSASERFGDDAAEDDAILGRRGSDRPDAH